MMKSFTQRPRLGGQSGAVLYTALVFLIVLTMFVLTMVRSGTFEQRMAANSRDHQRALEAAEAVVRNVEEAVLAKGLFDPFQPKNFLAGCSGDRCFLPPATPIASASNWAAGGPSRPFLTTAAQLAGLNTQPRYVVEILSRPVRTSSTTQCEDGVARITGRGQGNTGAVVLVQSIVRFRVYSNNCY